MTVLTGTKRTEHVATASQTVFPYDFRILDETHLAVYQEGTLLTLTTHYTVSNVGNSSGGNVTLVTGATVNDAIVILRTIPITQETDYVENDSFPAETHEEALDKLTMIVQELSEKLDRAMTFTSDSTTSGITLPEPVAGSYMVWNSGLTALENTTALGTTGAVFNEAGGAVDFRVESDTSTHMFFIDGGDNIAGFSKSSLAPTDGTVHIIEGDAGEVTADTNADELVIESGTTPGMSFLSPSTTAQRIKFGDEVDAGTGELAYNHVLDKFEFKISTVSQMILNSTEGAIFNDSGSAALDFRAGSDLNTHMFFVDAGNNRIGMGAVAPTDGLVHIQSATAGVVAANVNADELVLEGSGHVGATILSGSTNSGWIYFGDSGSNEAGKIQYDHAVDQFKFKPAAGTSSFLNIGASETVINANAVATHDLRVQSGLNTHMFFVDNGNDRIGMGAVAPTDGLVHIQSATAGTVTANASADELVIEGNGSVGMSFLNSTTGTSSLYFGDPNNNNSGFFQYAHASSGFLLRVTPTLEALRLLDGTGAVFNEHGDAGMDFRVESDLNTHMFFVDAGNNSVHIDNILLTGAGDGDLVMANDKYIRFIDNAGTTSANAYITLGTTDNMAFSVPATSDVYNFKWANGTARLRLAEENSGAGLLFVSESSADHSAPAANGCKIYTKDNGAGKTQLMARFATGAVQQIAIEP